MGKKSKYGDWKPTGKSIGQGGQGQIQLVENESYPDSIFALKRLLNPKRINRFKDEAAAGFQLRHKNIVNVIDFDCDNDPAYIVMDYYKNGSLKTADLSQFSNEERFEIFKNICEAVSFAHENEPQIIHRDLKPENIFLDDNFKPVVGDFGLCFFDDQGERITLTDEHIGSLRYIPPELEEGRLEDISAASDVYSLGKIFYWLITGKIFAREKHHNIEYDISNEDPSRESYLINEFLDKMITKDPEDRLNNGTAVLNEFNSFMGRISMGNNCIGPEIPQFCIYCGKGNYQKKVQNKPNDGNAYTDLRNSGFGNAVGAPTWVIFVCDYCGNTQIFRPDLSDGIDRWSNDSD